MASRLPERLAPRPVVSPRRSHIPPEIRGREPSRGPEPGPFASSCVISLPDPRLLGLQNGGTDAFPQGVRSKRSAGAKRRVLGRGQSVISQGSSQRFRLSLTPQWGVHTPKALAWRC